MLMKKFLSGVTALSVSLAIFAVPSFVYGVADANKTQGIFDLKCAERTVDYYEAVETKNQSGQNIGIDFKMTSFQEKRMDILDYCNKSGADAKFAHTRFLVSLQKDAAGDASIPDKIRLQHYIGSDEVMRFYFQPDGEVGIYGGEGKSTGYAVESLWKVSTTKEKYYNTVDIIEDCKNGAILIFVGGKLAAYSIDGATDGKFYGYSFSKNENAWDEGDVLSIKFDSSLIGHTLYNDGNGAAITLNDVIADAGMDMNAYAAHKKDVEKSIKYISGGEMFVKKQAAPIMVDGSRCIQAEEGSYTDKFALTIDRGASDIRVMKNLINDSATSIPTAEYGDIEI